MGREFTGATHASPDASITRWAIAIIFTVNASLATSLSAQHQWVPPATPDTVRFTESIRTTVTTRSGRTVRERRIMRIAEYVFTTALDTVIVSVGALDLTELAEGVSRRLDTDAVVGGRWKLIVTDTVVAVIASPFVPDELRDVTDVASAMVNFLPEAPPLLAPGARLPRGQRHWERLSDSAGVARFQWSLAAARDTTLLVADSVPLTSSESAGEQGELAWSDRVGPLSWRRRIVTDVTSRIRGRAVLAELVQEIVVTRH